MSAQEESVMSVCDLFDKWAVKQPDHAAVEFESNYVSYKDIQEGANRLCDLLSERGVGSGDVVPVLATRSVEMVVCYIGILKAGACIVPIDIEAWSEDRIAWTLQEISARVLVNLGPSDSTYMDYEVVSLYEVQSAFGRPHDLSNEKKDRPSTQPQIQPDDLAYIIFTSGTTSKPKGVMIPHRALLNYAQQGSEGTPFNGNVTPNDTCLLFFSPAFDACMGVIFGALCNGAELIVASKQDFLSCIARATMIIATPSLLTALQDPQSCPRARTIILGGEALPPSLIRKWSGDERQIYNAYGPTETTICSLIGKVDADTPVTLGQPMPNSRVVLLDGDMESDYGEICITGPGLALGYYKNEVLTATKFVIWDGERAYRTGDFARRTEYGLEFAGRADSFVKNRGFLVNLDSQVVPMLLENGAIMAIAFMYEQQLVAFVSPDDLKVDSLRRSLTDQYDEFLVPDQIRAIETIPLTANGKANNKLLKSLLDAERETEQILAVTDEETGGEGKPLSRMQILIAAISAATSLPPSQISEEHSFWDLGGNSLAAVKVLSYLRKRNLTIRLKTLLELPNLNAVCEAISDDAALADNNDGTRGVNGGSLEAQMTPMQTKMIQGTLKKPGLNYILLQIHLPHQLGTNFEPSKLKQAWNSVLQKHSMLRTTFFLQEERQALRLDYELDWKEETTTTGQLERIVLARSEEIHERLLAANELSESFVPVNALRLITVPGSMSKLLLSVHHAQVDGWSLSIILDDFQEIVAQGTEPDGGDVLISKHPQFLDFLPVLEKNRTDITAVAFWSRILLQQQAAFPRLDLPTPASQANSNRLYWTKDLAIDLSLDKTALEDAARLFRVTPSTLIYAAWTLVLSNYTSSDCVAFGAVFSGRSLTTELPDTDIERVVGPFLNTVPFPVCFSQGEQSIASALSSIYSQLLDMIEYQWSSGEVMASMSSESINSALQTILVTEYDLPTPRGMWTVEKHQQMLEFDLSLLIESGTGSTGLLARMLYDGSRYFDVSIKRLLSHFNNALSALIDPKNLYLSEIRAQIMGPGERASLLRQSTTNASYKGPMMIKDAFEAAAKKWPGLRAVESPPDPKTAHVVGMTYRELDEAANKVANFLLPHITTKIPGDTVVCVLTDGSTPWVVGILGVVKAGCICCPIDVSLPNRRIEAIAEQSGTTIFLAANKACARSVDTITGNSAVLVVEDILQCPAGLDAEQLARLGQPTNTFYLIFTSGSTGTPKGKYDTT